MRCSIRASSTKADAVTVLDHRADLSRAGANVEGVWGKTLFFIRRYPLGTIGGLIFAAFVLMAVFAGAITSFDPTATNSRVSLAPPGGDYILGADFMGRDMWSRIVYGARISLAVGIGSSFVGCFVGVTIGLLSGYFGGWLDLIVQRIIDVMQALPLLVMALVMAAALGPSLSNTIIAISIPLIPNVARVIRSNTLVLRELPYVEAARAAGMNETAIAWRHVLPNTLAPLIVLGTAQLGSAILTEASLSFLGLGIPEPHPSWGRMLSESAAEYVRTAPWLVIFPGIAISLAVFGTNLLGDALRDLLDPRQRG
jgi:peptide/nickel transport system permease protein